MVFINILEHFDWSVTVHHQADGVCEGLNAHICSQKHRGYRSRHEGIVWQWQLSPQVRLSSLTERVQHKGPGKADISVKEMDRARGIQVQWYWLLSYNFTSTYSFIICSPGHLIKLAKFCPLRSPPVWVTCLWPLIPKYHHLNWDSFESKHWLCPAPAFGQLPKVCVMGRSKYAEKEMKVLKASPAVPKIYERKERTEVKSSINSGQVAIGA